MKCKSCDTTASVKYQDEIYCLVHFYSSPNAQCRPEIIDKNEYKKQNIGFEVMCDNLLYEIEEDIDQFLRKNRAKKKEKTTKNTVTASSKPNTEEPAATIPKKRKTTAFAQVDADTLYEWQMKMLHRKQSQDTGAAATLTPCSTPSSSLQPEENKKDEEETTPQPAHFELSAIPGIPELSWRRHNATLFANALALSHDDKVLCSAKGVRLEEAIYRKFIRLLDVSPTEKDLIEGMENENRPQYNQRIKLFLSNLRSPTNDALRRRVLFQSNDWDDLAKALPEDLMDPETSKQRELDKIAIFNHTRLEEKVPLMGHSVEVDYVKCESCGNMKSNTSMIMAARQISSKSDTWGNKDDQDTEKIRYTCSKCSHKWYSS